MKFLLLISKNVRRHLLRSILTGLGTMVLVFVVTLIWSILAFLDKETRTRSQNIKGIVTERWQLPSQMPFSYAASLSEGAPRDADDYRVKPDDAMTWQFYGGTTVKDRSKATRESFLFAFALQPRSLMTMMNELDELREKDPAAAARMDEAVKKLEENRKGLILGRDKLKGIEKKVGDTVTIYSVNYKDIDLEFDIVGEFPPGRYDNSAAMNRDYLNAALDDYQRKTGKPHPIASKTLGLVWLRVPDTETFARVAEQVTTNPSFSSPAVKFETATSGIAVFLEAYRDLLWGMRWLLSPAICITLALVIANAISISVRERRLEFAVLKVLGYQPWHILTLVLGEALFLGISAGLLSSGGTWLLVNKVIGGLKFPIAFFGAFYVSDWALVWGPAVGGLAAFVGSIIPAWSARTVKVADVFARVA